MQPGRLELPGGAEVQLARDLVRDVHPGDHDLGGRDPTAAEPGGAPALEKHLFRAGELVRRGLHARGPRALGGCAPQARLLLEHVQPDRPLRVRHVRGPHHPPGERRHLRRLHVDVLLLPGADGARLEVAEDESEPAASEPRVQDSLGGVAVAALHALRLDAGLRRFHLHSRAPRGDPQHAHRDVLRHHQLHDDRLRRHQPDHGRGQANLRHHGRDGRALHGDASQHRRQRLLRDLAEA
mmetsp:Transcript_21177/g.63206  ORF Transcript_21177/g.63206 Transcript_21177/m.63206 type:complete len:239 (+) Transcript_21177:463-1179(+)